MGQRFVDWLSKKVSRSFRTFAVLSLIDSLCFVQMARKFKINRRKMAVLVSYHRC